MTERKVLNKYYPPDFDPSKIPRLRRFKRSKIFAIRTMAPFNMMCLKCRGYIFKAKKFNSRMEESDQTYLDLKEFRFHIRCPTCSNEIIYRTDRENNDYMIESGAKRSFEAGLTAKRLALKEDAAEKDELEKNPIKAIEKRTEESINESKMNNQLQNLFEKCKNSKSRDETIDEALEMLRQEAKAKESQDQINKQELIDKMMKEREKIQLELQAKDEENRRAQFGSLVKAAGSEALKRVVARKRQKIAEEKASMNSDVPEKKTKTQDESEDPTPSTSKNILGLFYDSD